MSSVSWNSTNTGSSSQESRPSLLEQFVTKTGSSSHGCHQSLLEQYQHRIIILGPSSVSWNRTDHRIIISGTSSESPGTVPTQDHHFRKVISLLEQNRPQDHHLRDFIRASWNNANIGTSSQGRHQRLLFLILY